MYSKKDEDSVIATGIGCGFIIVGMIISAIINSFTFPYAINEWLVFFGKEATVTWWQGMLIGFVPYLGQFGIFLAVVTWILMLFV